MPLDMAVKHALLRIGAVAVASAVTAVVLLGVGRFILVGDLGLAGPSFALPSAPLSPSPSPSAAATPTPSPTATARPTEAPLALTSFRFGGRSYVGIVAPDVGRTFA